MDEAQKEQVVADLKIKHSGMDLFSYESPSAGAFFVHRRATAGERRIYMGLMEEGKRHDALDSLMSCVLYPDKPEFKKVLDETPFVAAGIADAILVASGVYTDAVRKKL